MKKSGKKLNQLGLLAFKGFSSFCVAYVLALLGKELILYGTFAFVFVLLSIGSSFFYLIRPYKWLGLIIINLILVLTAIALNSYVSLAYNN